MSNNHREHLSTPLVIIIFNRPDFALQILKAVSVVKPKRLFIVADGPRQNRPEDVENCLASRAVADAVSWDCQVEKVFSDVNLGCGGRIASGLDYVFSRVDRAIILDDDCIPHPSFFRFCDELLERYRDDERIQTISGSNFLMGRSRSPHSYHFSKFHHNWGWATWARSWATYDGQMTAWPEVRDKGWLRDILVDPELVRFFGTRFNRCHAGRVSSFAYPYQLGCWLQNSLAIIPNRNLISNVGFDSRATNTRFSTLIAGQPAEEISIPLSHPPYVIEDRLSDAETFRNRFAPERANWARSVARRVYYAVRGTENPFSLVVPQGQFLQHSRGSE